MTTSHPNFDNDWIFEILSDLGYQLSDNGNCWRTYAHYRGGSNNTSLVVFKNSGFWIDHALNEKGNLFNLVERTAGFEFAAKTFKNKKTNEENFVARESSLIKMEKLFPIECLNRLLPHFDFYTKRGVSPETLNKLKAGYATGFQMYQRIVFPVFNKTGKIHGFSGRSVFWQEGDKKPKWKHTGSKNLFCYPLHQPDFNEPREAIEALKTVNIVESIGDFIAAYEAGCANTVVSFSLSPPKALITELMKFDLDRINIVFNKDEENNGQIGAAKLAMKLSKIFDTDKIGIVLPTRNDLFAMKIWEDDIKGLLNSEGEDVLDFCERYYEHLSIDHQKTLCKLKKQKCN